MKVYRTHNCNELTLKDVDEGNTFWLVHRIRDHGGVLFNDLRDHYGITQIENSPDSKDFGIAENLDQSGVFKLLGK